MLIAAAACLVVAQIVGVVGLKKRLNLTATLVVIAISSGVLWSDGVTPAVVGYSLLSVHDAAGSSGGHCSGLPAAGPVE